MLSTSDVFTVAFISFQLDVSFCSHDYTFGVGSVGVDGAWFVGASRWYRVSFPFTGPSYLSNTLCSVEETDQLGSMGYICTGITSRGSPTLVIAAVTIALLKPILWYFCLCGSSWGAESSR